MKPSWNVISGVFNGKSLQLERDGVSGKRSIHTHLESIQHDKAVYKWACDLDHSHRNVSGARAGVGQSPTVTLIKIKFYRE